VKNAKTSPHGETGESFMPEFWGDQQQIRGDWEDHMVFFIKKN
jgi:hypothetical protein